MSSFTTETEVTVVTASASCTDSLSTACISDIIGWTPGDCTSVVVSGWQDANSAGDCDDGFDPCDCAGDECYFEELEGELLCLNQDGTEDGCNYDEGAQTCTAIVGFYNGSGVELVGGVVAMAMSVLAVMAM